MNNIITDYTLTVIEENQVPLAASFGNTFNYGPIVAVVMVALVVALLAYTLWFSSHKAHIQHLMGNEGDNLYTKYFIHPVRLVQLEYEVENTIANQYIA